MKRGAAVGTSLLLAACGGNDEGEGTVRVMAYGEQFIEDGIAASEMNDGWAIDFTLFEVTIGNVEIGGAQLDEPVTLDLSASSDGSGHEVGTLAASAGRHEGSRFELRRINIEGNATRDDVRKTFQWQFDRPVKYFHCDTATEVADGKTATFQITVHADHLFYDSLVATAPQLLFSPLAAADADDNGAITSEELADTDIGSYDPGNEDADDLWKFLSALSGTFGHVDGEGHCLAESLDH